MRFDAMVPEMFVPAMIALAATKLLPAFEPIAVVRNAGINRLSPFVLSVPSKSVPVVVESVKPSPAKDVLALDAIAVVR
jgi:hypothetical protein